MCLYICKETLSILAYAKSTITYTLKGVPLVLFNTFKNIEKNPTYYLYGPFWLLSLINYIRNTIVHELICNNNSFTLNKTIIIYKYTKHCSKLKT